MLDVLIWGSVAVFFFLFELGNPGLFFSLSFFCGALGAGLVAFVCPDNIVIQAISFFVCTVAAFFVLRYLVQREQHHGHRTNVYALEGRHAQVITAIHPTQAGLVKLGGEVWSALSLRQEFMAVGTTVEVVRVQGTHLMVISVIKKGLL